MSQSALYASLALAMVAHWQGRKLLFARSLYEGRRASIKRVPGLPTYFLLFLSTKITTLCLSWGSVIMCLFTACLPTMSMRVATGIVYAGFQISDANMFNHGTYPVLFVLLGLALLRPTYAQASALGWDVHFFLASGISKLHCGGISWTAPVTMKTYLSFFLDIRDSHFHSEKSNPFSPKDRGAGNSERDAKWGSWRYQRNLPAPPFADVAMIFPGATRFLLRHDFMLAMISASAITMECIIIPLVLFLDSRSRYALGMFLSTGFHIGIGLVQSVFVMMCFFPDAAIYSYGMSSPEMAWDSIEFALTVCVGFHSLGYYALFGRLLPSKWPCNAIALFHMNGNQFAQICDCCIAKRTRFLLSGRHQAEPVVGHTVYAGWIGENVLHMGTALIKQSVFDGLGATFNFTVFNDDAFYLLGVDEMIAGYWDSRACSSSMGNWLKLERVIVEGISGALLTTMHYAQLEESAPIVERLLTSQSRNCCRSVV